MYITFPTSILPIFHLPFYNFPSFLLNFHPFPLVSFFPDTSAKISQSEVSEGHSAPRLLRHCLCSLVQVLLLRQEQSPASECEFHHFSKLTLLRCLLHNLFSFKFSANLTSKNVRGNHIVSSLVCSLASEFTNQKFSKTSTFSCPYLIFHSVILFNPPFPIYLLPNIGVLFAPKIFVGTCTNFVYILLLSCCSKHTGSLGAHVPAYERPRKFSSEELDPVSYIVGSQWRNVQEASVEIHFTCHQLLSRSCSLYSVTSYN